MASIVSSLSIENEMRLQGLFSRPVRFHLLYKSSHHGAQRDKLSSSFDNSGKFLLAVFLQSGSVRGTFMSKTLNYDQELTDAEAFVFELNDQDAKQFPVLNISIKNGRVGYDVYGNATQTTYSITFGSCFTLKVENVSWYADFQNDVALGTTWPQESNICCVDVELHRVQDVSDSLPSPWREVSWKDVTRENLKKDFVSYKPLVSSIHRVKALLLGPVGSGKSSLVNSVKATMYQRFVHLPNIGKAVEGFTKKMTTYNIRTKPAGSNTALSLCDVMSIGDEDSAGLSYHDALAVIKGHVPEGYKFQRDVEVSDSESGYIKKCIPQLIALTHVDQVCPAVEEDVKYTYSSRTVQDKMKKAAELVGLPLSYVLPVKNYVCQLTVDCSTDILLLSVVMSILKAVDDTLEDPYSVQAPSPTRNDDIL